MTRLQAVDARVAAQQAVAVLLLDPVVLELAHRVILVVLGKIADHGGREQRHVLRRRVMLRRGQPRAVLVVRARHPQAFGVLVHHLHEGIFGAADALRQGDCRVVARLHDHAHYQQFHGDRLAELDEGARALGPPGVLAHDHGLVELEFPRLQLRENDIRGHQFREAGRLQAHRRIPRRQHLAGVEVDEGECPRIHARRRRYRRIGTDGNGREHGA